MARRIVAILVILALLFGPCEGLMMDALRKTAHAAGLGVYGSAHGAKVRCGGKFDWRGHYLGPYCVQTRISRNGSYDLYGRTYYPAVNKKGYYKGWYVRVGNSSWRDSVVTLYR